MLVRKRKTILKEDIDHEISSIRRQSCICLLYTSYSSDQLELAKNEIYARHGRKFVTQRIADYFNSKSWYKGTVEPETFDADTSVFNEYEVANIQKIADTEGKLRSEGK